MLLGERNITSYQRLLTDILPHNRSQHLSHTHALLPENSVEIIILPLRVLVVDGLVEKIQVTAMTCNKTRVKHNSSSYPCLSIIPKREKFLLNHSISEGKLHETVSYQKVKF